MNSDETFYSALGGNAIEQTQALSQLLQRSASSGGQSVLGYVDVLISSCLAYSDEPIVRRLAYEVLRTVPSNAEVDWTALYSQVQKDVAGNRSTEESAGERDDDADFTMRVVALQFLEALPSSLVAQFLRQERAYFDMFLIPSDGVNDPKKKSYEAQTRMVTVEASHFHHFPHKTPKYTPSVNAKHPFHSMVSNA